MNGQNFGVRVDPAELVAQTEQGQRGSEENSDLNTDYAPVDAVLVPKTAAMDGPAVDDMSVQMAPQSQTVLQAAPVQANVASQAALLGHEESEHFRTSWNKIQGKFVDEPRMAVQEADTLVSEVIKQITEMFVNNHTLLESQWKQGNDVSTEDLRMAFQHYRSFFNRLVV